jgi:hypothetical protein
VIFIRDIIVCVFVCCLFVFDVCDFVCSLSVVYLFVCSLLFGCCFMMFFYI